MATKKITLMEKLAELKAEIEETAKLPRMVREMHDNIVLHEGRKAWRVYWSSSEVCNELMALAHDLGFMPREGNEAVEHLRAYAIKVQQSIPQAAYKQYAATPVGEKLTLYLALLANAIGMNDEDTTTVYNEAVNSCTQSAWEASETRRAEAKAKSAEVEAGANALAERLGLKK